MATQYFFANGNEQRGPHTLEELVPMGLRADSLVWYEGLSDWKRADALPELSSVLATPAPIAPAPIGVTPPQIITTAAPAISTTPLSYQNSITSDRNNGMAIASLVLGIVSLPTMLCYLFGMIPGILAIIFGIMARKQIKRGEGQGFGMATAGLVCGSISVGLIALLILIGIIAGIAGALH